MKTTTTVAMVMRSLANSTIDRKGQGQVAQVARSLGSQIHCHLLKTRPTIVKIGFKKGLVHFVCFPPLLRQSARLTYVRAVQSSPSERQVDWQAGW